MAATILGIILGIVTISDEGIELAVGVHIINNIYASSFHSSYDVDIGNLPSLITSPYDPIFGIIHAIMMSLMFLAIIKPNLSVLTSSINQVKEVKTMIPISKPMIGDEEINEVINVLKSGQIAQGQW